MRQTWQCDYCGEVFLTKEEVVEHEKRCGKNPENKITDPTIFRLSMILDGLPWVIATALYELRDDLPFLIREVERAGKDNCPHTIYEHKNQMIYCLQKAQHFFWWILHDWEDFKKTYPELVSVVTFWIY